jgi:hypothetical protein
VHHALHLTAGALAIVALAPAAWAHGAYPAVRQIVADPNDDSRLFARATYGLLTSTDHGKSWRWACSAAAGYGPTESPLLAVGASGAPLMGTFDGLLASADGACTWSKPSTALDRTVTGIAVGASRVWALTSTSGAAGAFESELWLSSNGGTSFEKLGAALDDKTLFTDVGVSASDPTRLYLTGSQGAKAVFFRSVTEGKTWEPPVELPTTPGATAQLAAVHPTQPDVVYVRAGFAQTSGSEGVVLASKDGGATFTEALRQKTPLLGFTLSPDGQRAFAAFGDPHAGVALDAAGLGLFSAKTSDDVFGKVRSQPTACVSYVGAELWACTSQADDGFEIGRSADGGASFVKVMELSGLSGPLDCGPSSTVGTTCTAEDRDDLCQDTGNCAEPEAATDDSGCGCRSATGSGHAGPGLAGLLAVLLLLRRRAR